MTELEKLDELRKRFDITYTQAKEALHEADGDLCEAVINLEKQNTTVNNHAKADYKKQNKGDTEEFVKNIIEQIKGIIQEGNVTKIRLKNGDKMLIEIPATIGVVGAGIILFSPLMLAVTALGTIAAVSKEMVFEIEKSDGSIERRFLKWPEIVKEKQGRDLK